MKILLKYLIIIVFAISIYGCNDNNNKPRLIVYIIADQLSEDMFAHYEDLFTDGYRWLLDNGVWFTNAHHEHWYTTTGPGHFVLGSGQHPIRGGVIGNYFYHRGLDKLVYCVDDTLSHQIGRDSQSHSYRQITSTTIGDWLKAESPNSKVYSVSGKDRAAILMGGKNPDLAIWYDWRGHFISSDYYADEYPAWLTEFNNNLNIGRYRDSVWVRELEEDIYNKYARIDNFDGEIDVFDSDTYSPIFPIGFDDGLSLEQIAENLGNGPWLDNETLNLAKIIIKEEELGQDEIPDFLFVSLSSADVIGHNQGPFSQEAMDNQIKLDKKLRVFIDFISDYVKIEDVLFIVSSDHGTIPLPEYLVEYKGIESKRINREDLRNAYKSIETEIKDKYGDKVYVRDLSNFYYDYDILKEREIEQSELDEIVEQHLRKVDGIGLILTKNEILNSDPNDQLFLRIKNFTDPILGPDIIAIPKEYWTTRTPLGTTHGTPYNYDSNVPIIIAQKGKISRQIVNDKCATVDLVPTIAKILEIKPLNEVDGKSLF